jgi:hypothetical protein
LYNWTHDGKCALLISLKRPPPEEQPVVSQDEAISIH